MGSFGKELPDQVELIDRRTEAQIQLLQDVQTILRERAALEAQYAKSLQAIAKKSEKLNGQHAAASIVGDNPSKPPSDSSLESSTLYLALAFLTETLDRAAQEHASFSEVLNIQVADELKALEKRKEETRKKHSASYQKLITDRDQIYSDRLKYYSDCTELEQYRQKHDRASDDKHAERVAKQHEQMQISMLNRKNTYLVSISVSNGVKELFYDESVPEVENQYQTLQTSITSRLVGILQHYFRIFSTLTDTITSLQKTLESVSHQKDHDLFIEHNRRPFSLPSDWSFEPCPNFYDTANISIEPEPKVFLQNKLARSQEKLEELQTIIDTKAREAQKLNDLAESYSKNPKLGPVDSAMDDAFDSSHIVAGLKLQQASHEEEIRAILGAIGDDHGAQAPHSFKPSSFAVPTQCAYCKVDSMNLMTNVRKTHANPKTNIPADCSGSSPTDVARRKSLITRNTSTRKSASSASQVGTTPNAPAHSFRNAQGRYLTTPGGKETVDEASDEEEEISATVLFDFGASSSIELSVKDDGSGWVKVRSGNTSGLVPAAYMKVEKSSPARDVEQASPIRRKIPPPPARSKKKLVRGLYDYEAAGDDEISVTVGETIELTPEGENYGDGWYQGRDANGKIGLFPSNYVELLD
ncbi:uncharacterized protein EI90DRAFT_3035702 [Cantharellus anzutake]|uniref:uncharacterized protein n=1 Tax=Cantharellus anzutake TaxID=1750568 RepID=UPI001908653D|nr:uncharacterized protein EI90DRAFT_3035702 [Cantharellus anzutake]KAF8340473.1 hypothetical protein EI90DRAFT_3035702 [Cantharellus anzutake]